MVTRCNAAMRALTLFAALTAATQRSARAEDITLDEALARAQKDNPELAIGAADVDIARGQLTTARTVPYNPELGVQVGPSFGGSSTYLDFEVSLSQPIELGGKRGNRVRAAEARGDAASLRLKWTRQVVAMRVRRAFFLAVVARDRVAAGRDGEAVAAEVATASNERLRLGAGTQLEVNVAAASLGRARAQRTAAERGYAQALTDLAAALGAPVSSHFEPAGSLPDFATFTASEDDFVARAMAERPDLAATRKDVAAADADLALARSLRLPDAALGVSYGHSGLEDSDTVLFGVSITVPFWNRNQGSRASAQAGAQRAAVVETATRREAERAARAAYTSYILARDSVQSFDRDVIGKLGDNLALARASYASGKIGLVEFNLARRELVETRFAYLDALVELVEARYALELAVGGVIQ